ncbi:MAG TPA: phosphoribosyl-ATP diphosphatase [Sediminispirochaeta sp.]|nr:phosphoribosyl-ATP diphosphatase [Sediminispirochaeta sp.]
MNAKAYTKSIERGELWILHPNTGRVLPYQFEHQLESLKDKQSWFEAVLSRREAVQDPAQSSTQQEGGLDEPNEVPAAARRGFVPELETADEGDTGDQASPGSAAQTYPGHHAPGDPAFFPGNSCAQILETLEDILRKRAIEMPEGSYTTHLFASGGEKIRKKLGEEAVELILAPSAEQIVYEAADLLYHLGVLLVAEGLSYQEICRELQRRHGDEDNK